MSNTIVFILWVVSRASPPFISIPFSAPFPVPTIIAVGVARPSAHGQAITKTAINTVRENTTSFPDINHASPATIAITTTTGTKYPAIISASFAIGAFEPWASSTNLIICEIAVSLPTFSALNLIVPFLFILAPTTELPIFFSTGILSPVNIDSSTEVWPSITVPSTGILEPGLTIIISPTSTSSIGISISLSSLTIIAVLGLSPINFFIASPVLPFARDSKYLPSKTNVIITPALSKYIWCTAIVSPWVIKYREYKLYISAALEPIVIKESIVGAFAIIDLTPLEKNLFPAITIGIVKNNWVNAKFNGFISGLIIFGNGNGPIGLGIIWPIAI